MRTRDIRKPLRPTRPLLRDLHGMPAPRAWGEALAKDIEDYKAQRIQWSEVACGVLLYGPPGVGKTTFAKALAATCKVPLVASSYANWQTAQEGHLGDVMRAMREDFALAKDLAKEHGVAILFIDELDSFPSRANRMRHQEWWTSVINAFLAELDGITSREGVVVVGAANYIDRIDAAILRAGRLDTKIAIGLPNVRELAHIIRYHLRQQLATADLSGVAVAAFGMSGADIKKLVADAGRLARQEDRALEVDDLFAILEERIATISCDSLQRMALREAGKAAAAMLLGVSDDVCTSLLGCGKGACTTHATVPIEALTRDAIERRIMVALAGRAAEVVLLGDFGADASGPCIATHLAAAALGQFGMGKSKVWKGDLPPEQMLAIDPVLCHAVDHMLDVNYDRAVRLIEAHRSEVGRLADALIAWRALTHDDIKGLLGPKH